MTTKTFAKIPLSGHLICTDGPFRYFMLLTPSSDPNKKDDNSFSLQIYVTSTVCI